MNFDFLVALPEMVLLAGTCALLIVDLFVKGEGRRATFILAGVEQVNLIRMAV